MNQKTHSLGTPFCFLGTQIFFQTERGCPFPTNRKIRSLGIPSCFLENQIFQAERGGHSLSILYPQYIG